MPAQKRVFIIHGWDGYPEEGWFPWLKNELIKKGFLVQIPAMPKSAEPKIEAWVSHLSKIIGKVDVNTFFVGHSIGCQTIMRYLETIGDKKVGGAVFVAGWFVLSDLETAEEKAIGKPWIETPLDFNKIKPTTSHFVAIFSKDDPVVPLKENLRLFEAKLHPEIIIENRKGHFSGSDGVKELPSALKAVLKISRDKI